VNWFVELEIVKSRKTYNDIKRIALLLKERFGDQLANEIKPSDVENFQMKRRQEKAGGKKSRVTPGAVNREVAVLRRIYNLAVREELAAKNPCWKVQQLKEHNKREAVLSLEGSRD